jgi:hypothetical protein
VDKKNGDARSLLQVLEVLGPDLQLLVLGKQSSLKPSS